MKRFFENTLISRAFSKVLRVAALLCVLLGISSSAWGVTIQGDFGHGWQSYNIDNPCEIYVEQGSHGLKIESQNLWWGCNDGQIERNNCTNWELFQNTSNCSFYADVAGTYTFKIERWTATSNGNPVISVTYPPTEDQAGFFDNEALVLTIASKEYKYNKTHSETWNLGTNLAQAPKLTLAILNTWKKENQGRICEAILCAKIDGKDQDIATFSWKSNNPSGNKPTGTNIDQKWQWTGNFELPSTPGTHNIEFWVKAKGKVHGTSDCGSNDEMYLNNGSNNYKMTYSMAALNVANVYGVGTAFEGWPSNDCDDKKFIALSKGQNNVFSGELTGMKFNPEQNNVFKFTTKQCWTGCANTGCPETLQFYDICSPDGNKMYGVAVNKDNDQNSVVTLSAGYTTPITLYVDKTNNTYWIQATKETPSTGQYFYCDMEEFHDWTQNNTSIIKAIFTKTDKSTVTQTLEICTSNQNVYVSQEIDLSTITKVKVQRYDANANNPNDQIEKTLSEGQNCIKVTAWRDGVATKFTGKCGGTDVIDEDAALLLTYEPKVNLDNNTAQLGAYLRYTMCDEMTEYGFVYCIGSSYGGCTPTESSVLKIKQTGSLQRGQEFSMTTPKLPDNNWYGYRAYAIIDGTTYLSAETKYFTFNKCTPPVGGVDGLTFTVDASLGETHSDPCTLTFGTLELAIKYLKDSYKNESAYQYVEKDNTGSYNLRQNVIMNVRFYDDTPDDNTTAYEYAGTTWTYSAGTDKMNGGVGLALMVEDINRASSATKTLTIKGENPLLTPHVHHMLIRNSRNIVLDNLHFVSDPTGAVKDNSFEIDVNTTKWNDIAIGTRGNANIIVQNCSFYATGFTGVHVSGYDGVTFINNVFDAKFEETGDAEAVGNAISWGASAKFLACKNIKFVRNNFTGDHCTMLWIQESQNMLFMNNVFWNTNKYTDPDGEYDVPAAARLITQFGKSIQKIGFYYNTMYFADNGTTGNVSKYDFLAFTQKKNGDNNGPSSAINEGTIVFKYNNCYSYDQDCPGKSDNPFLGKTAISTGENYCPNNFWSIKADANFAFGCTANTKINVSDQMCGTTALDPSMLVINGTGLNLGDKLTVDDVQTVVGKGISLTDDEVRSDRYNNAIRPKETDKKWTYGAYQQKASNDVDVIIWQGDENENWDDRNNWVYLDKDNKPQPLTCLQILSDDLTVIIPEGNSSTYPTPSDGIKYWPQLPSKFDNGDDNKDPRSAIPIAEQVTAGSSGKFAKTIQLEYGAAIKGVENLYDGTNRYYGEAIVGFTAPRTMNILVGTIVQPWDDELKKYRNIKSGDYYIDNHMPHVYMRRADMENGSTYWGNSFTSREVEVSPDRIFVIYVSNQYGQYKLSADEYNDEYGLTGANKLNGKEAYKYPDIKGIFADEQGMRTYTVVDGNRLFNNSYPCNIDASQINVSIYDYENASWNVAEDDDVIKPQHGFVLNDASSLTIDKEWLTGGDTKSRSARISLPKFYLHAINATSGAEQQSKIIVKYDELHTGESPAAMDTKKVFSDSDINTPELYMIAYDDKYARFHTNNPTQQIPLGIRLQTDMRVHFKLDNLEGFESVTLYDAEDDYTFNLKENPNLYLDMKVGDIVGRYFLNVSVNGEIIEEPEIDNEGDDVTTDVESSFCEKNINIYTNEVDNSIQVVTSGVELQTIYVSDMAGKTMRYVVSGNSANLQLPVAQGVYTINVIGDTASRTEKVILK